MVLKEIDDKTARIRFLETLERSDRIDDWCRGKIREDLNRLREGLVGEKEAAFHIESALRGSENHVIIHDLRLERSGVVTQIDHLIMSRLLSIYVVESKNYGASVTINELGEFSLRYGKQAPFGVESPIEQNKRHVNALRAVFSDLNIAGRATAPTFRPVILFHPKAVIKRPPPQRFDTSYVIKADQFGTWREKSIDGTGVLEALRSAASVVSLETLTNWGKQLVARHQPAPVSTLPPYVKLRPAGAETKEPPVARAAKGVGADAVSTCAQCGAVLSPAVVDYCRKFSKRFNGQLLCYTHQRQAS